MSYLTLEAEIDHGKVVVKEPDKLPQTGRGLLTILSPTSTSLQPSQPRSREPVQLPLIRGDGTRIINPTPEDLDASFWD